MAEAPSEPHKQEHPGYRSDAALALYRLKAQEDVAWEHLQSEVRGFYDPLAEHYHLLFEDWERSIERQAKSLNSTLTKIAPNRRLRILDCACGIGTQALGFAMSGHQVVASDLSPAAVARADREAKKRGLSLGFHVSDMTSLVEIKQTDFDVVAVLDNALPHLSAGQIRQASEVISTKLKRGGILLASIRDYDKLVVDRPTIQEPAFFGQPGSRRIVHQVWDWLDHERYSMHLYLTLEKGKRWSSQHFISEYRALSRKELSSALQHAAFTEVSWLLPEESGFYQPIVTATKN